MGGVAKKSFNEPLYESNSLYQINPTCFPTHPYQCQEVNRTLQVEFQNWASEWFDLLCFSVRIPNTEEFLSCLCVSIKDKMIECPAEKFIHAITMMGHYNKSVGSLLYFWKHYSRINWKKQCLSHPTYFHGEAALLKTCTLAMILWNILFKMWLLVCHCKCFSLPDSTSPMSVSK